VHARRKDSMDYRSPWRRVCLLAIQSWTFHHARSRAPPIPVAIVSKFVLGDDHSLVVTGR